MKFECWSKIFINNTTWNRKRSTKKKTKAILKNRKHDEFHFTVLNSLIIRNEQLQNIEIQKSKKLELKIANLLSEKANFRSESSLWLDRNWLVRILCRHFAKEFNPWSPLRWAINQSINQSINRSIHQSIDQSINN